MKRWPPQEHGVLARAGILVLAFLFSTTVLLGLAGCGRPSPQLAVVCSAENDLYRTLSNSPLRVHRFETATDAVEQVPEAGGLLVLADSYPEEKVHIPAGFFGKVREKKLRLYIEFPDTIPGVRTGGIKTTKWERAVVSSDFFLPGLRKMRILTINDCHYLDLAVSSPHLVVARVAGFDSAVYGLSGTTVHPILFQLPANENVLISATKLSHFVTGRYAPKSAWQVVWGRILAWLQRKDRTEALMWEADVHPTYGKETKLRARDVREASRRGVEWYYRSNLLATRQEVRDSVWQFNPNREYGADGVRECFLSRIRLDGTQPVSESRRADCTSETAMAIALRWMLDGRPLDRTTARRLQDFIYFKSNMRKGPRSDPRSPEFGFIDWYDRQDLHKGVYYADDNARVDMGTIATLVALGTNRWNEMVVSNILAHFRATSIYTGFKPRRLDGSPESGNTLAHGWQRYRNARDYYHFAPHYQAWIMAMYLWLYDKTGYEPLLKMAKLGIRNLMHAYPDQWEWTNGLQQERARMILPLAWLVRIEDTPEHRAWLDRLVSDLLACQDRCGAIREEIGQIGRGKYAPPKSNAEYGTNEAPLLQENGDPVADMLYTSNFAFLSLTEAAAATGEERIERAADKLASFFVRIQTTSRVHPELDGAWYRGFDFQKWDYWGSNADLGWGVWSTETGWTQGWITTVLMLREMDTNFWDFTAGVDVSAAFAKFKKVMLE